MEEAVIYSDCTLYEALQSKIPDSRLRQAAENIEKLGIGQIQVPLGFSLGGGSGLAVYVGIPARLKAVEAAWRQGFKKGVLFYRYKREEPALFAVAEALAAAKALGMEVSLEVENASSLTMGEWKAIGQRLKESTFACLVYGDEASRLEPVGAFSVFKKIKESMEFPLGFHGKNDCGLAAANTLSALRAGLSRVVVSIGGLGGHAPYEEVLMASKHLLKCPSSSPPVNLSGLCQSVLAAAGQKVPLHKAVIGSHVFVHESGLHVHGVLKDPRLYEAFSPEEVGLSRQIVMGKSGGASNVRFLLERQGVRVTEADVRCLLKKAKKQAMEEKKGLSLSSLMALWEQGAV